MSTFLVTGASGFVGRALCRRLLSNGFNVRGTLLAAEDPSILVAGTDQIVIDPIGAETSWDSALTGIDTIIHLAARVHVMQEIASDPLAAFRTVNTAGTERLALEAAAAGVRRFVFMSTIGVNGDNSGQNSYSEADCPSPHNSYAVSKHEAEQILLQIYAKTGMEVVIIRAPLVYGPGCPGNFLTLLKVVKRRFPLPLASIANKRSLIYVGNLVDALATCATHPSSVGQTFLVSDGEDVSTPELLRRTATALGVSVRLWPVPLSLLWCAARLTGRVPAFNRLAGSLTVDSSHIQRELGWKPPFTMEQGLMSTAAWFLSQR